MTPCTSCGRGGQALGLDEALRRIVEPDQIGEGAPDIDCDDDHAPQLPCVAR